MKTPSTSQKSNVYGLEACPAKLSAKHGSKVFSRPHSAFRIPHSKGFTLIELMMVVLVILLLSGLLFKLGSIISDRSRRAAALSDIERLSNALTEYYAIYGQYPQTTGMKYKYQDESLWSDAMQNTEEPIVIEHVYGLVAYLYERKGDDPWNRPDRDAVTAQWQHHIAGMAGGGAIAAVYMLDDNPQDYSNRVSTIKDPWGADYGYESRPPYLSYRLWSSNLD